MGLVLNHKKYFSSHNSRKVLIGVLVERFFDVLRREFSKSGPVEVQLLPLLFVPS